MTENSDERRASKLLVVVAIYVIVDLLALVPALVFTLRSPELAWFAMGPYLFLTAAGLAAILYLALRWGLLEFRGPHMSGMGRYLATVGLLTAAFTVVIILHKGSSIIVLGARGVPGWHILRLLSSAEVAVRKSRSRVPGLRSHIQAQSGPLDSLAKHGQPQRSHVPNLQQIHLGASGIETGGGGVTVGEELA